MRIGIDVSQLAHKNTGVAQYLANLVEHLVKIDSRNEYILFFSSLRRNFHPSMIHLTSLPPNVALKKAKLPPSFLHILWNRLHIMPIEQFIGEVDVFITSDWTEPPAKKAKKVTILYDLIVYTYPQETDKRIIDVQKKKISWVKKESHMVFCISQATKHDAKEILGLTENRLAVLYPGMTV